METTFNEIEINNLIMVHTEFCWFTGVVLRKYEVVNNNGKIWGLELLKDDKRNTIQFTSENIIDLKVLKPNSNKEKIGVLADKYGFEYCDENENLHNSTKLLANVLYNETYEKFNSDEKRMFISCIILDLEIDDVKFLLDFYVKSK